MLLASYDIVFSEIPGEVTLALNLSCCPNGCPGCHSPHLQQAIGEQLDEKLLAELLEKYGDAVTTVAFMGGDADPGEVNKLAKTVREWRGKKDTSTASETGASPTLLTAWYSGRQELPADIGPLDFDFIKLGPYIESLGGLTSPETNQRFYSIDKNGNFIDKTALFQKKELPLSK